MRGAKLAKKDITNNRGDKRGGGVKLILTTSSKIGRSSHK